MMGANFFLGASGLPTQGTSLTPEGPEGLQEFPEDSKSPAAPQAHILIKMLHLLCFLTRIFLAPSPLVPRAADVEREGNPGGRAEEKEGR